MIRSSFSFVLTRNAWMIQIESYDSSQCCATKKRNFHLNKFPKRAALLDKKLDVFSRISELPPRSQVLLDKQRAFIRLFGLQAQVMANAFTFNRPNHLVERRRQTPSESDSGRASTKVCFNQQSSKRKLSEF